MNFDILKDSIDVKKAKDDATTIAEHSAILLHYKQTGYLDRDDAIKKYREFNNNHPDYYVDMRTVTVVTGTAAYIGDVPNDVLVMNLDAQLFYLTGKKILEGQNHAQPTT